ncbi:MAG: cellulase family glycosylhydrolase [Ruminococcus sp.]|jgi:aryl-phospho-beta-D-glucosidase BglC (GH1 family)|nr:cellulase family glycosylhydrolase [Ruminococcus sp.]
MSKLSEILEFFKNPKNIAICVLCAAVVVLSVLLAVNSGGDDIETQAEPELTQAAITVVTEITEATEAENDSNVEVIVNETPPESTVSVTTAATVALTTTTAVETTTTAVTQTEADITTASTAKTVATAAATSSVKPVTTTTAASTAAKPATTTAKPASTAKDYTLEINAGNSWGDGAASTVQYEVSIKNNTTKAVSGWTATIVVGKDARMENFWNADIAIKDGVITATPLDYNKDIPSNGSVSFGMQVINGQGVDGSKSSVKIGTVKTAAETVGGNDNNASTWGDADVAAPISAKDVPAPTTDDWLFTDGSKIIDKNGKEVWMTGVNWFGYNTGTNTFDGISTADLNGTLASIADHGFNLLRIPISAELLLQWKSGEYPKANYNQATNSYLNGMTSLEIFDYIIDQCRANGIKIMMDIHSAKTDAMGHMYAVWYNGNITEQDFLDALAWCSERYKNDDTIIAYDLKNEPHGKPNENPRAIWNDSKDPDNWKYIAEKAAKAVLDKNPNVLIMVEGLEIYPKDISKNGDYSSTNSADYHFSWWGGNLRGVKDFPVDLGKFQNKLVYSPHDYGPTVYQQPWFQGNYTFDSLMEDCWGDNWFYIHEQNIAPLLIGEWGGFMREPNLKWMTYLRQLIKENKLHHTFWCLNPNSGDTGGLLNHDWVTWDTEKYNFVKEVLWQKDGKFVGLDHKIPLGKNGITLTDA